MRSEEVPPSLLLGHLGRNLATVHTELVFRLEAQRGRLSQLRRQLDIFVGRSRFGLCGEMDCKAQRQDQFLTVACGSATVDVPLSRAALKSCIDTIQSVGWAHRRSRLSTYGVQRICLGANVQVGLPQFAILELESLHPRRCSLLRSSQL